MRPPDDLGDFLPEGLDRSPFMGDEDAKPTTSTATTARDRPLYVTEREQLWTNIGELERAATTPAERALIEAALEWATLRPLAAEEAKRCDAWPIYPRWVRAREALQNAAEAVRKERGEAK